MNYRPEIILLLFMALVLLMGLLPDMWNMRDPSGWVGAIGSVGAAIGTIAVAYLALNRDRKKADVHLVFAHHRPWLDRHHLEVAIFNQGKAAAINAGIILYNIYIWPEGEPKNYLYIPLNPNRFGHGGVMDLTVPMGLYHPIVIVDLAAIRTTEKIDGSTDENNPNYEPLNRLKKDKRLMPGYEFAFLVAVTAEEAAPRTYKIHCRWDRVPGTQDSQPARWEQYRLGCKIFEITDGQIREIPEFTREVGKKVMVKKVF